MKSDSRRKALEWPYPRYEHFEKKLRGIAAKWFTSKGFPVDERYPFILADRKNWANNIILPDVADHIQQEMERRHQENKQGFPLHKYVHHGLSSQAMLFNLVGPLIVRQDFRPLRNAFEAKGVQWPEGEVEAVLEVEDREVFAEDYGQPTSIDLVIRDGQGSPAIFVESKFVEKEFGGCSVFQVGNCDGRNPAKNHSLCYLHFIGRQYWAQMEKNGLLKGRLAESPMCLLANHYQFFREVLFAIHQGGYFVLLYDSRNPTFVCDGPDGKRGLLPFLTSLIPDEVKSRVSHVSIQEVFEAIKASGSHADWTGEFATKYGLLP